MTIERAVLVRVAGADQSVSTLVRDIRSAESRAAKALPGDRVDIVRFEQLSTKLELIALRALSDGARSLTWGSSEQDAGVNDSAPSRRVEAVVTEWLAAGDLPVEVRLPFAYGATVQRQSSPSRGPSARWAAPSGIKGSAQLRFGSANKWRVLLRAAATTRSRRAA